MASVNAIVSALGNLMPLTVTTSSCPMQNYHHKKQTKMG